MTATIGFTDNYPHEGSYVVYLNGIEVPVQSVQVRMSVNATPSAMIELVPDPTMQRIGAEDRMEVAVFYLDDIYPNVVKLNSKPDFRLLYEGEVLGWSYTTSPAGRRISLKSMNFLKILYDLHPNYITGPEKLAMSVANPPAGEKATFITNAQCFPWNRFFYGFDQARAQLIKRPYDLIVNILNACMGVEENEKLGSSISINFFARYMRRISFINRFLPSPILETEVLQADGPEGVFPILRAVRDTKVIETLVRGAARAGAAPIWPTLQQMFLQMYYETLSITTAPIAQVDRVPDSEDNGTVLGPPQFKFSEDPDKKAQRTAEENRAIDEQASHLATQELEALSATTTLEDPDAEFNSLFEQFRNELTQGSVQQPVDPLRPNCILNYTTKPQWLFGIVPSCNVIFPSMIQQYTFDEDYASQPTRLYANDMWYAEMTSGNNPLQSALSTLRAGYPPQIQRELDKRYGVSAAGISGNVAVSGKNLLVWPEEFYKGPKTASIRLPNWFETLAQFSQTRQTSDQQNAAAALKQLKAVKEKSEQDALIQKFIDQGLLPPQVKDPASQKAEQQTYTVSKVEEILRVRVNEKNVIINLMRKGYARYEYYRQRALFRSGAVIMTFNPYIVPGFPVFIFDDMASGQHALGYVTDVVHNLTKNSWSTEITFTFGQTLDEFMQELFDARVGNTVYGVLENQASAPVNPIEALREVTQEQSFAEDYFSLLFHQGSEYPGVKSAAFDFDRAIRLELPSGETHPFSSAVEAEAVRKEIGRRLDAEQKEANEVEAKIAAYSQQIRESILSGWADSELTTLETDILEKEIDDKITIYTQSLFDEVAARQAEQMATAPKAGLPSALLQQYVFVRPSKEFEMMFRNHTNAMRFVSRPICTLDEYTAFRGKRGTKTGKVLATDPVQGKGAPFYEKILNLTQGPGDPPTFDQNNNLVTPPIANVPDTRADWESRLKAYRSRVLFKRAGYRPD